MIDFFQAENSSRTDKYLKNERKEALFRDMNLALSQIDGSFSARDDLPTIFIFGLPRSGTTLLYQLLTQCLDIGYVNNLIAKFWLAPVIGIEMSKAVLGELRHSSYTSNLGQTNEPHGPHEFAYYWRHWLKVDSLDDMLVFNQPNTTIDWEGLGYSVRCMHGAFGNGIVFKTMYAANHMKKFYESFPKPLFIYVKREPSDVALSILSARKAYYGKANSWWATYPPNYREIAKLPFPQQIAGQVWGLQKAYDESIREVPEELVVSTSYVDLCKNPQKFVASIQQRYESLYGIDVPSAISAPDSFDIKNNTALNDDEVAVLDALHEMKRST